MRKQPRRKPSGILPIISLLSPFRGDHSRVPGKNSLWDSVCIIPMAPLEMPACSGGDLKDSTISGLSSYPQPDAPLLPMPARARKMVVGRVDEGLGVTR